MDEYIELLNKDNKPNGTRCLKSVAHKNGYYHATIHVWLYTRDEQILIQKRHSSKKNFPNLWDVSVAGHISFQELPIHAATREVQEEIGLSLTHSDLKNIGISSSKHIHSNNFIDHELHHLYIANLDNDINCLTIQKSEVAEIKLIPIETFKSELKNKTNSFVPHKTEYYKRILEAIEQELQTKKA